MKPNPEFTNLPQSFWAAVKSISQQCGYTVRGKGVVKVPNVEEITDAFEELDLSADSLASKLKGRSLLETLGPILITVPVF